jgi:ketol-acid reductoisomerase
MSEVLRDIQTGKFVRDFMQENAVGPAHVQGHAPPQRRSPDRAGGREARAMMPWISKGKMVDRARN